LPYPPSVNRYWRRVGNRTVLSREARRFRARVKDAWFVQKFVHRREALGDVPVEVKMIVKPPDKRRRDLDNVIKAVLDGIESAGVIADDWQVRRLELEFGDCVDGGAVLITIGTMPCDTH
ncbi:MAG: RusA family crossover junction endodeoxyribonuclease, partial [Armatimonadota bacterium]